MNSLDPSFGCATALHRAECKKEIEIPKDSYQNIT
jgi:hypothetical protein